MYFRPAFAAPDWLAIGSSFLTCLGLMSLVFLIELGAGWVQWEPQLDSRVRRTKLFRRCLTCIPLALMEEAVFRGILLEQIHLALPPGRLAVVIAVTVSSVIFAALHFVRPDDQRPFWQPAMGLFLFGVLCGAAYTATGHRLWMPVTIHAAGILVTETMRLYTVFRGPRWMIGYGCFPHCGLIGVTALAVLGAVLLRPF
jgi:membrane protease YdiL (CAAX protease family)